MVTNMEHVAHLQRMANEAWIGSPERAALDAAIAALSAPQPPADGGFTAADMADASAQGFRDGVASVGETVGDECAPAEAQPCGCGEATCAVPWEPGCGLGKSEQHAEAQPASDGGFTAADMMDARQEGRKEAQQPAAVDEAWQVQLADALECFWNPAIEGSGDDRSNIIGGMVQGFAAVAYRLREHAAQQGGRSDD